MLPSQGGKAGPAPLSNDVDPWRSCNKTYSKKVCQAWRDAAVQTAALDGLIKSCGKMKNDKAWMNNCTNLVQMAGVDVNYRWSLVGTYWSTVSSSRSEIVAEVIWVIEITSYLRRGDGSFVRIVDCNQSSADPDYVEGAIGLSVNGVPILTIKEWDHVDQLWSYVSEMVQLMSESNSVSTYFPDQPIKLSFRGVGDRILVSCEYEGVSRAAMTSKVDFMEAIKSEGRIFFEKMKKIFPGNSEIYEMSLQRLFW